MTNDDTFVLGWAGVTMGLITGIMVGLVTGHFITSLLYGAVFAMAGGGIALALGRLSSSGR
jgi:hypothetical protein